MGSDVRVDKWLWAVRIFKTRSIAAEVCKKGHITIDGVAVKPSRIIKINEVINVRKLSVVWSYKVLGLAEKRMSAKLIVDFVKDVTAPEQLEVLEMQKNMSWFNREKGTGRPTKKDRRELDDFMND